MRVLKTLRYFNPAAIERRRFFNTRLSRIVPALLWLAAAAGFAQQPPQADPAVAGTQSDPFAMDLASLLNTKVTTASKFSEKLTDAAAVVSVVTQDELQRFGGTTLLEVLERVAGLSVSSAFFADSSLITVRGDQTRANAGHILILINGRPVREILEGGVSSDILASFPIGILERIEIVKGPGSVLYGSDAFSGVINLITKKAEGHEFSVGGAGGAAGERSATEEILYQRGPFDIVEGGQYHNYPWWNITERAIGLSGSVTEQNATIRNDGTGGYLGVDYKALSFMSSYTEQEAPSFVRGVVGDTRLKRGFTDLGYRVAASSIWNMTFDATYTRSVMDAPDYPTIHRDSYEADLEWTNFITFSSRDRLTFGTVYNHIDGLETYFGVIPNLIDAKGSRNAGEAYAQFEHKLTGELKLIGGVQANKIGAIAVDAVPRGGVLWNPWARWTMKLLYGGAYNAPSLDETLINHPGLKGNPDLVPEKVGTLDAQVSFQSNRFLASVDYFYSRQTDLILQDGATHPAHYYNDPTPVHFQGGEVEGKYYLWHDWFLIGSVLYQVNDSGSGAANLSPSSSTVAKIGGSYLAKGSAVSLFDAYQGPIAGYGSTLNPPAGAFHSVSAHARFDVSRHWMKNDNRGVALFLNADDLLNGPIWLPALGSGSANTLPVTRGRTVYLGAEVWQK
jgi:outer membrane receptor protein involved in Fe transport